MAAPIIVYHYPFSPYGRRITWYLALRGLPYAECVRQQIAAPGVAPQARRHVCSPRGHVNG